MSFEKRIKIDQIEIVESGCIQVRTKTTIFENGVEISNTFHRHIIAPGDDYSKENSKVQAICAVVHTPDIVETYKLTQIR